MTIMAPKNKWELSDMIKYAVDFSAPIAIRYPRGEAYDGLREYRAPIACGKSEWNLPVGSDCAVCTWCDGEDGGGGA